MTIKNEFTVDVEVDQTNNNLTAHVNLKARDQIGVRNVFTSDVRKELSRQGWQVSECITNATLSNTSDNCLAASWVFSLGDPVVKPVVKEVKNTIEPAKTEVKQEKKTTTRRRRTTKNNTKK